MKKQQESLKNMVYQAILNGIFTDEYKPNQIINEQELVQKFGCSKTPIREALVTLCNEGILHSFPRFGYQIFTGKKEENDVFTIFPLLFPHWTLSLILSAVRSHTHSTSASAIPPDLPA